VLYVTYGMKGQTILWPKRHTMIHKTLHMKLNIEQHEPIKKPGMNSCTPIW